MRMMPCATCIAHVGRARGGIVNAVGFSGSQKNNTWLVETL